MAARRKADLLIAAGHVQVNGVIAVAGMSIEPNVDRVTVSGRRVRLPGLKSYRMLNKPAGVLTTVRDDRGRPTVLDTVPASEPRLYPVGRLDLRSRGLILLTDDGDLALRLMHPRWGIQKEYRVRVLGKPDGAALRRLRQGITVEGERFAPAQARIVEADGQSTLLAMVLWEGRKREVRRIWDALGYRVLDLERVRIGPLTLGRLRPGGSRPLSRTEISRLRAAVGL